MVHNYITQTVNFNDPMSMVFLIQAFMLKKISVLSLKIASGIGTQVISTA